MRENPQRWGLRQGNQGWSIFDHYWSFLMIRSEWNDHGFRSKSRMLARNASIRSPGSIERFFFFFFLLSHSVFIGARASIERWPTRRRPWSTFSVPLSCKTGQEYFKYARKFASIDRFVGRDNQARDISSTENANHWKGTFNERLKSPQKASSILVRLGRVV